MLLVLYGLKSRMGTYYDGERGYLAFTEIRLLENKLVDTRNDQDIVAFRMNKSVKKPQQVELRRKGLENLNRIRSIKDSFVGESDRRSKVGDFSLITVFGRTKGKGFQGVMKRWGFKGQPASHGCTKAHRKGGSIGSIKGQIWKGTKMPGRMGNTSSCTRNLRIIDVDGERIRVRGSIPGNTGSLLKLHFYNKEGWKPWR